MSRERHKMMAVVKRDGWNMDGLSEDPGVEEDDEDEGGMLMMWLGSMEEEE